MGPKAPKNAGFRMKFRQFERMGSHLERLESSGDFGDSPFEYPSDLWMDAENVSGRRTRKSTKHSKSAWCSWKTADNVQADWIGSKHSLVLPKCHVGTQENWCSKKENKCLTNKHESSFRNYVSVGEV